MTELVGNDLGKRGGVIGDGNSAPSTVAARVTEAVLDQVFGALRTAGPLTRRQLADRTGYSRATLSGAVATLVELGRVEEFGGGAEGAPGDGGAIGSPGRGRPSRLLRVDPARAEHVGIEVGRAHVAVAVADASDAVILTGWAAVDPGAGVLAAARAALALCDDLCAGSGVSLRHARALAVGTPGPVLSPARGAAPEAGDAPRDGAADAVADDRAAVRSLFAEHYGIPVTGGNNIALTAAYEAAAGGETEDLVFLRVDEGVGGGLVLDGTLATGGRGAAGELGHVSVDPEGERCPCGGRGCLELVAGMAALLRATGEASPAELLRAVETGRHRTEVDGAARATARVLAGVLAAVNPRTVVVGGSVGTLPGFLDVVDRVLRDVAPAWTTSELHLRPAVDDHLTGALGALVVARAAASVAAA